MIEAFRYAEAALVSPFRYSAIVWAGLFSYLFWGDVPDGWAVVGTGIVIMSGLYILHRELLCRRKVNKLKVAALQKRHSFPNSLRNEEMDAHVRP